jgi:hypothetical protein
VMVQVGWLLGSDGDFTFPGFSRHNGTSAKTRVETNRRVAKLRNGNRKTVTDVTEKPLPNPLPEKRREENAATAEAAGPPSGPDAATIELIRMSYFRRTHMRDTTAAIESCLKRHPGKSAEILAGTRAVSAVVASWSENEKIRFVKQPIEFFNGDHWADDPQFWRSQRDAKAEDRTPAAASTENLKEWEK